LAFWLNEVSPLKPARRFHRLAMATKVNGVISGGSLVPDGADEDAGQGRGGHRDARHARVRRPDRDADQAGEISSSSSAGATVRARDCRYLLAAGHGEDALPARLAIISRVP
jgi:hypothetical protein